jgi:membrane protein YqaA with SNARE-associated domain
VFRKFLKFDRGLLRGRLGAILILALLVAIVIVSQIYKQQIVDFGNWLLVRFHKSSLYAILFTIAAISSTIIPLPVWIYVFTCVALGFNYLQCSMVIGLGSSLGSAGSYALGRYFRNTPFFERKFNEEKTKKWQQRSKLWCGMVLFIGTVSPIPMDAFYVASGVIRFPALPFLFLVVSARFIRYVGMGYIFFVLQ